MSYMQICKIPKSNNNIFDFKDHYISNKAFCITRNRKFYSGINFNTIVFDIIKLINILFNYNNIEILFYQIYI